MATPVTNFAKVTVGTLYDAAATSVALAVGHGSRLPSTFPYPLSWWDSSTYSDPSDDPNREIIIVTARTGDALTITRGAEGTSASDKNTAGKTYKMLGGITAGMWLELISRSLSETYRGLLLQTHPNAAVEGTAIALIHADAIVMDDGEEIPDWNNVTAGKASSGAGGLDTGTAQTSTWYEVYAIYNGTTKALLLHRAKDYFLDEDITAGENASQGIRSNVDNSTVKVSQGFKVDTAGPLPFIDVKLLKTGVPTGLISFTIETSSAGVPSGSVLATSDSLQVQRIDTAETVIRIPFRSPATLSAATQYHVVAQGDWAVSAANFISWRMDGSAAAYANGSKALFDSDTSTWTTDTDDDLWLKVYITRNDSAVVMPTGYSKKAKIGYAYHNASDLFTPYVQVQNKMFCGYDPFWKIGALTNTTPDLVSLAGAVPPVPVMLEVLARNASACNVALGPLKSTDLTTTVTDELHNCVRQVLAAGGVSSPCTLAVDHQGLMAITSAGTLHLYVGSITF